MKQPFGKAEGVALADVALVSNSVDGDNKPLIPAAIVTERKSSRRWSPPDTIT